MANVSEVVLVWVLRVLLELHVSAKLVQWWAFSKSSTGSWIGSEVFLALLHTVN